MKFIPALSILVCLMACWPVRKQLPPLKVWGSKAIYAEREIAKEIKYLDQPQAVRVAGNIYAFGHCIYQIDKGEGIHVIDNTVVSKAARIGFITVKGCEQLSIKGSFLYTNSYDDLITIDISDPHNIKLSNRIRDAFPDGLYNYPFAEPDESGYYTCNQYSDSVVVGWVKDSIYAACYKN
jgi:hypothetical protein